MMAILLAILLSPGDSGEALLEGMYQRYLSAPGIQWKIESVVYSEIFDEADTTYLEYLYSPPDTFSLSGEKEKIVGVADTIWVLSERHHQVHKKNTSGSTTPIDFILNWKNDYDLEGFKKNDSVTAFYLHAKEDIAPAELLLTIDNDKRVKTISYTDTSGDLVTLSITREKLKRPGKIYLFYLQLPSGYDFIDLTE